MTNSDRLDRIEALVESNARAIASNNEANRQQIEGLVQVITEFSVRTEGNLRSLNAAVERLERICDYLVSRNGSGGDNRS
jgi:ATP phosphoribosyltransferase